MIGKGEVIVTEEKKEWYSNRDLFEMMQELDRKLTHLCLELKRLGGQVDGKSQGSKDLWGYVVGGLGILFAILSRIGGG